VKPLKVTHVYTNGEIKQPHANHEADDNTDACREVFSDIVGIVDHQCNE